MDKPNRYGHGHYGPGVSSSPAKTWPAVKTLVLPIFRGQVPVFHFLHIQLDVETARLMIINCKRHRRCAAGGNMNRREIIKGATASLAVFVPGYGLAQTPPASDMTIVGELPPLPSDLKGNAADPPAPYTETALVGSKPPSKEEVDTAFEILRASPFDTSPIDVAQYFVAVGAGAYGEELRSYVREWPIRANPVIFHLFSATRTKPEGDTTAWCAAFVNWCLMRARAKKDSQIGIAPGYFSQTGDPFSTDDLKNHSTNSASSGSFRCWQDTNDPQRGDIAVLANKGTGHLTPVCRGQGHVAFFLNSTGANRVRILGGNQTLAGSNGAVTVAGLSTAPGGRFLKFVKPK